MDKKELAEVLGPLVQAIHALITEVHILNDNLSAEGRRRIDQVAEVIQSTRTMTRSLDNLANVIHVTSQKGRK
ncbi:MAG: hypothetical protein V1895_00815 [Parcubacteria group bacterium]